MRGERAIETAAATALSDYLRGLNTRRNTKRKNKNFSIPVFQVPVVNFSLADPFSPPPFMPYILAGCLCEVPLSCLNR